MKSDDRPQPLEADEQADEDDHGRRHVRSALRKGGEPGPSFFCVPHTPCGGDASRNHGDGKTDAEAQHKAGPEGELLELKTEQKHRDRGRARYQAAGQPEGDDLRRRDVRGAPEAAADILGMGPIVGVDMGVIVRVMMPMRLPPGPPQHPQGNRDDEGGGCDLEIGSLASASRCRPK